MEAHARLSEESRNRLERNPLRILDSKDRGDRAVIAGAPDFGDNLDPQSQEFFAAVRAGLSQGIVEGVSEEIGLALANSTATSLEGFLGDIDFAKQFRDSIEALRTGVEDFTETIGAQARAEVEQTTQAIRDFKDRTSELGLDTAAAAEATRSFVELLVGVRVAEDPLSELEIVIEALNARFAAMAPLLEEVGLSADLATQGLANALGELREGFNEAIRIRILAITDPTALQLEQLNEEFDLLRSNAEALGVDLAEINRLYELQVVAITGVIVSLGEEIDTFSEAVRVRILGIADPTALELELLNTEFDLLRSNAQALGIDLAEINRLFELEEDLITGLSAAIERDLVESMEAAARAFESVASAIASLQEQAASLQAARFDLLLDPSLSPLSPEERLIEARRQLGVVGGAFHPGDDPGALISASRAFLEASRAFCAT